MPKLTQELVLSLFNYRDGELFWKKLNGKNKIKIGDKSGSLNQNGYYVVGINGKLYRLHRIIYLYHYGYIPKMIDHIDRNSLNNKIENLRESNKSQNGMNRSSQKNSISQIKGVSWDKNRNQWRSIININGKQIYCGRFNDKKDAIKAYNEAAIKYHGEYAYLNDIGD